MEVSPANSPPATPALAGPGRSLAGLGHRAMATVFEVFAFGPRADVEGAAWAAFEEIDRLEGLLSHFVPSSDVARINRLAAGECARVSGPAFDCLLRARDLWQRTRGAFDPTVGCLLAGRRRWDAHAAAAPVAGDQGAPHRPVSASPVPVGMQLFEFNADLVAVAKLVEGVGLDLGGIGKGFALDAAAQAMRLWDLPAGLIHAGQSTMLALGSGPAPGWRMRLLDPRDERTVLGELTLPEGAIGTSANTVAHVLDPRTGRPAERWLAAWSLAPTATEADALSTAFLVMDEGELARYVRENPAHAAIVVERGPAGRARLRPLGDLGRYALALTGA